MIAQFTATLCAALLSGAALYVMALEQPAPSSSGPGVFAGRFRPSGLHGLFAQALLACLGLSAAVYAGLSGGGVGWLIGALGLVLVVPFTLVVMSSIRWRLPEAGESPDEALEGLLRWSEIHVVRGLAGAFAFLTFWLLLGH